jgi:hypothetical protein
MDVRGIIWYIGSPILLVSSAIVVEVIKRRCRFSLRTLLFAMTLVAVRLGMIISTS